VRYARRMVPWFTYIRLVARHKGVHFRDCRWVVRLEHGEREGRPHYHFLLSGLPERQTESIAGFLGGLWSSSMKQGFGPVRVWDGRDAAAYITKGNANGGANSYESAKFATADKLIFGQSFVAYALESLVPKQLAKLALPLPALDQITPAMLAEM